LGPGAGTKFLGIPPGSIYVEPFTTVTTVMPIVVATTVAALAYGVQRIRAGAVALRAAAGGLIRSPLTYCILATGGSCGVMLSSGFITNRYLADTFPLVAIALIMMARFLLPATAGVSGRVAAALVGGVALLVTWSLWMGLGLGYQSWWLTAT
jgi:hypothetical protein